MRALWRVTRAARAARAACAIAALAAVGAGAAACSAPGQPGPTAAPGGAAATDAAASDDDARAGEQARQEERLAAIQFAMNQLDEGAQLCWAAAAAVEGYQLAGELAFTIEIAASLPGPAAVTLARDNTKTPRLLECMQRLLADFRWAPPLAGQTIQLPFKFRAPSGQSVIDRTFVPAIVQGKISVAVLLDERNTGNAAASMFEVTLAAGATTELRVASRDEVWAFLGEGLVTDGRGADGRGADGRGADGRGAARKVAAGDMMMIPRGGLRQITAGAAPLRAVLVMTPGGEEGAARAGALPTQLAPAGAAARGKAPPMLLVPASAAQRFLRPGGAVALVLDPTRTRRGEASAALLTLDAGAGVPPHRHAAETELLYILEGGGTMTVGGAQVPVTATSVVQVPPGAEHSFTATAALRAIQLYTPAGPEQRFKSPPAAPPAAPPASPSSP